MEDESRKSEKTVYELKPLTPIEPQNSDKLSPDRISKQQNNTERVTNGDRYSLTYVTLLCLYWWWAST